MKLENIVYSGSFNQELDLSTLSSNCLYIEYGKNHYHGAYIKFDNHSITIYSTGKYIIPGMKSSQEMWKTFEKIKEILLPFLNVSLFTEPKVRNMVCSSKVNHKLNLSKIYTELVSRDMDIVYEPEAFPGLILKTQESTFNVFSSGKFLILGCTTEIQAEAAEEYFLNLIRDL